MPVAIQNQTITAETRNCYAQIMQLRHFFSVFVEQHKIGGYVEKQCVPMMDPGGLKYWTCGVCTKALNHKQDLMRHVESFHVETSPYICQLCHANVEFKTKRGLQRHTNANHR